MYFFAVLFEVDRGVHLPFVIVGIWKYELYVYFVKFECIELNLNIFSRSI